MVVSFLCEIAMCFTECITCVWAMGNMVCAPVSVYVCCIFVFILFLGCGFVFCVFVVVVIVLGCVLVVCMCVGHCCGHYRCIYNDVFF